MHEHYTHKHTRTHMHIHMHAHRHVHRGLFQRHSQEVRACELMLVSRNITYWKGSTSPLELVMAINTEVTIYSVLTTCQVSRLVLHNHDLILFFQQPYLVSRNILILQIRKQRCVSSPNYHTTLIKSSKVIYFHVVLVPCRQASQCQ